jgi:hypothetical protein
MEKVKGREKGLMARIARVVRGNPPWAVQKPPL